MVILIYFVDEVLYGYLVDFEVSLGFFGWENWMIFFDFGWRDFGLLVYCFIICVCEEYIFIFCCVFMFDYLWLVYLISIFSKCYFF